MEEFDHETRVKIQGLKFDNIDQWNVSRKSMMSINDSVDENENPEA